MFKPKCFKEVEGYGIKEDIPNKCIGEIDCSTLSDCGWGNEKVLPQYEKKCQNCKYFNKINSQ